MSSVHVFKTMTCFHQVIPLDQSYYVTKSFYHKSDKMF